MTAPAHVRTATEDDLPAIDALTQGFLAATSYGHGADPDRARHIAETLVRATDGEVFVVDRGGTLTGYLGVIVAPHFLSGLRTAFEVSWWVDPAARGDGLRLLRRCEAWALEQGAEQIQGSAPTEDVERLFGARGYTAVERTYVRPLLPAWPMPAEGVEVVDDVLVDPEAYRQSVLAGSFGDLGGFHGIGASPSHQLMQWIPTHFPALVPRLTFMRQSPLGQLEPHFVHCDRTMGEWLAVLYLNPEPPPGDGTVFWRDTETGAHVSPPPTGDAAYSPTPEARFTPWYRVPARFNRIVVFPAAYYHSRALFENFGTGDDARLIQVVFGGLQ